MHLNRLAGYARPVGSRANDLVPSRRALHCPVVPFWTALLLALLAQCSLAGHAQAQLADTRRLSLSASEHDLFGVHGARVLPHLAVDASLLTGYAHDELLARFDDRDLRLIQHRVTTDLAVSLGLYDRIDVGLALPVVWTQSPIPYPNGDSAGGLGALEVHARGLVYNGAFGVHTLALTAELAVGVSVGGGEALMHHEGVTYTPRLVFAYAHPRATVALDVAYAVRSAVDVSGSVIGDDLRVGVGVEAGVIGAVSLLASVDLAYDVETSSPSHALGIEALAAVRWRHGSGMSLTTGFGGGLGSGLGVPDFRAVLGVAFTTGRSPEPVAPDVASSEPPTRSQPPVDQPPPVCPCGPLDAPARLGLLAVADADPDPDGDALPNQLDRCPSDAEDVDGFEDGDGCPDPDNDHDGVLDAFDKCPTTPEVVNGVADDDGCPDEGASPVAIGTGGIDVAGSIAFETGKSTLLPASVRLIEQVATVLIAHPEVGKLRVEGHTDNRGDPEKNVDLSERRARAVVRVLVERGVDSKRLLSKGFGAKVPIAKNTSEAGRAKNRRVEFVLVTPEAPR